MGFVPTFGVRLEQKRPLFTGLLIGRLLGRIVLFLVPGGTVQYANGVGFQFNGELRNDVLDDPLAVWNLDRAVVFTGAELALHENMCSFDEPACHLRKACAEGNDFVPLRLFFPRSVVVLPRFLSGDADF